MMTATATSQQTGAPVTWLYVPGDRPERFEKALHSGADVVIIDLEDAVAADAKDEARTNVVDYLDTQLDLPEGVQVHVRVNNAATDRGIADLGAVHRLADLDAVRLPKVSDGTEIDRIIEQVPDFRLPVYAILETAAGIENASPIANHPQVAGLAIGEADLRTETGIADRLAWAWLRARVVVAAAAAGLPPVAMSVYTHIRDLDGLAASCAEGRTLGFFGRAAIHPDQLPVIRHSFAPDAREVADAQTIVNAVGTLGGQTYGAFALPDGRFIDAPIIARARGILEQSDRLGTRSAIGDETKAPDAD